MTTTDIPPRIDHGAESPWNKRAVAVFVAQIAVFVVGWCASFVGAFVVSPLVLFLSMPPVLVVLIFVNRTIFSIAVSGWRQSRLSSHIRAEVPPSFRDWREVRSSVRIGGLRVSAPIARWRIGPQAVALSIFLLGDFYLPMESIVRIQKTSLWQCRIEHTSPDLKSPILTGSNVYQLIVACLPQCMETEP
jgi:hypothetical protein